MLSNTKANPQNHLRAITLRSGKKVEMRRKTQHSKEKESIIEDQEELVQQIDPTPGMEKMVPPPVKEYVPYLPYSLRLKKDQTNEQFKPF